MNYLEKSLLAIAILGLTACQGDEPQGEQNRRVEISLSRGQQEAVETQNHFGFRLLANLMEASPAEQNIVISPLSASMDLCMIAAGTDVKTAEEIYNVLGCIDPSKEVNSANSMLLSHLSTLDNTTDIRLTNSLWIDKRITGSGDYSSLCRKTFEADIYHESLATNSTMKKMNEWARKNTNGMIDPLLKYPLDDRVDMSFFNALYFKGKWTSPFEKELTKKSIFHCLSGADTEVDMMHKREVMKCLTDGSEDVVRLYYGNMAFSITLVLPKDGTSVVESLKSLSATKVTKWEDLLENKIQNSKVNLSLPRFTTEYNNDICVTGLYKMGLPNLSSMMFPTISDSKMCIGNLWQSSAITIDETGTEASSVTYTGMDTALPDFIDKEVTIDFDHPFYYWISETSTKAILFAGVVTYL